MQDNEVRYNDGQWHIMTLGHFIGLLINVDQDIAVRFRVTGDTPSDEYGKFLRNIEMTLVPDGYVAQEALYCERIHKTLKTLLETGVVT